jgi:hypothetical protein
MPLAQDRDLIGYLLLATRSATSSAEGRGVSGADVAYLLPTDKAPIVIGTSLAPGHGGGAQAGVRERPRRARAALKAASELKRVEVRFADQTWVAHLAPLDPDGGASWARACSSCRWIA